MGNLCTTVALAIGASVYFDYQQMGHVMRPITFWGAVSITTGMGSVACYLFTTANQLIQKGKK
ncbi:hypothetical protein D4L85_01515 [Chryseolinea soli]|uniref:Uncharacterized protein n=1 Tax=Chryseolinea soli TaxID=2321403 RepID=A0A385SIY3_9BACT|nr:hypothetical protein D4L85_01515 [Chryseolinea soli]